MIISFDDDFNIRRIANSGQCFRFIEKENEIFENTALGHVLRMRQTGEAKVDFDCDSAEFDNFWRSYFDLDTNYSDIRKKAANDPFLNYCCSNGVGIRILKQDSWETFISFIIQSYSPQSEYKIKSKYCILSFYFNAYFLVFYCPINIVKSIK